MKKRYLLTLFIILLFSIDSKAQTTQFGIKGGLNIANLIGDVNDNVKGRTSFHGGIVAEFSISDMFSIQPELLYSSQGYTFGNVTGTSDYINIPVMGKFYPIEGLSIEMGPQLGFLLGAKEKDANNTVDVKEVYKSVDFGLNFGASYKLDMGVNFGVRYNLGLSKILDTNNTTNIKNGVFQLYIGYFFN